MYRYLIAGIAGFFSFSLLVAQSVDDTLLYNSILNRTLAANEIIPFKKSTSTNAHFTTDDWRKKIDAYWGSGISTAEKLTIFDNFWEAVRTQYAAFQNLSVNVTMLHDQYRQEIEQGVSRGRFAAIMNHFSLALNEAHTICADIPVNFGTALGPGVPIFVVGPWQRNDWFGACLTLAEDSSIVVYKALPNHVLGLVAGDIILGYDGIPWKKLYNDLLLAELPIQPIGFASTKESMTHCLMASAGLNWHLFQTIDILKASTGDTVRLATEILQLQKGAIWGNEQLPVKGVPIPDILKNDYVSWGIIESTNIGYIYVASWNSNPAYNISNEFADAVYQVMYRQQTSGLIIDMRNNDGGWMPVAHAGYALLFDTNIKTVAFDIRDNPDDPYSMKAHPTYTSEVFTIPGNHFSYYDKPIAILTGPGAISNGDFESFRLRLHPNAQLFGKSSCGAFATSVQQDIGNSNWFFLLTTGNGYPVNKAGEYLTHTNLEIDRDVWLTQEGILNNQDDVVSEAVDWINLSSGIVPAGNPVNSFTLFQNYPNPFNPTTTISYIAPANVQIEIKIFNIQGREIFSFQRNHKDTGKHEIQFDGFSIPSGLYFYSISTGYFKETKKMILIK
ncbi:MAG: T9SS type A sorting domain-containing protein [Calditrichaeota bacterium]|nr:T9SS type A sorting domain-containing protein [Calditrichota bacterium]